MSAGNVTCSMAARRDSIFSIIEATDCLLVFDAIDYHLQPGTLKLVKGDEVPKFTGAKKMSLHQTGFQEVLTAADLLGAVPHPRVDRPPAARS